MKQEDFKYDGEKLVINGTLTVEDLKAGKVKLNENLSFTDAFGDLITQMVSSINELHEKVEKLEKANLIEESKLADQMTKALKELNSAIKGNEQI